MSLTMKDRIAGCLVGYALGDALGAPYEHERAPGFAVPLEFREGIYGTRPGEGTDDSAMAKAAAKALLAGTGVKGYLDNLVAWLEAGPSDIGNQTYSSVTRYRVGLSPLDSPLGEGNGGLFPVHVAACFHRLAGPGIETAMHLAEATHPASSPAAATLVADYVQIGANSKPGTPLYATGITEIVAPWRVNIGWARLTVSIARRAVKLAAAVEDALPALVSTISLGGDTDSNGAVAGGLLGACFGMGAWRAFPELDKLEDLPYWLGVAESFAG